MDYGHWHCDLDFEVDDYFGFVYRVTDLVNNKQYLGRKQFHHHTRKKVKGRKNRKRVIKEGKWREYTTSSRQINDLIAEHGLDRFKFEIIELCKTKGELSYREAQLQWEEKVLEATFEDGTPKYYNGQIGAIKFRKPK
jgi:hypothetical protein